MTMKKKSFFTILAAAAFLFAACEKAETPDPGKPDDGEDGNEPVEEVTFVPGTILAKNNETSVTLRQGTDETKVFNYYFETDDEVAEERTVTLKVDETLVGDSRLLPEANYEFTETFTVPAGSYESATQTITFNADGLEEGEYVLPIAEVVPEGETASEPLVYNITVRVPAQNKYRFADEYKVVLYVDTDTYDPRLVTDYVTTLQRSDDKEPFTLAWMVNLRRATLELENGRAVLSLGSKLSELLGSYEEYLLPIQDQGSKLCLSIECDGADFGFCNLTEEQMDDFVSQVADLVRTYDLDGVNLWDQNAGYENAAASGLPEMNTTSYPLLIQKLRDALGTGRLITLADVGEPTAYFHDTEATGGIEVGKLIDYAWSAYIADASASPVIDPWNQGGTGVSDYARQPIAGLSPENYGCIAVSTSTDCNTNSIHAWKDAGLCQSKIVALLDTTPRIQGGTNGGTEDLTGGATLLSALGILYHDISSAFGPLLRDEIQMLRVYVPAGVMPTLPDGGIFEQFSGYGKWKWGWDDEMIEELVSQVPGSYVIYD